MTGNDPTTTTATDAGAPVALTCPECGEPARAVPPREWPLVGWAPRPAASHHDGTPLCPVIAPHGYEPAQPGPATRAPGGTAAGGGPR